MTPSSSVSSHRQQILFEAPRVQRCETVGMVDTHDGVPVSATPPGPGRSSQAPARSGGWARRVAALTFTALALCGGPLGPLAASAATPAATVAGATPLASLSDLVQHPVTRSVEVRSGSWHNKVLIPKNGFPDVKEAQLAVLRAMQRPQRDPFADVRAFDPTAGLYGDTGYYNAADPNVALKWDDDAAYNALQKNQTVFFRVPNGPSMTLHSLDDVNRLVFTAPAPKAPPVVDVATIQTSGSLSSLSELVQCPLTHPVEVRFGSWHTQVHVPQAGFANADDAQLAVLSALETPQPDPARDIQSYDMKAGLYGDTGYFDAANPDIVLQWDSHAAFRALQGNDTVFFRVPNGPTLALHSLDDLTRLVFTGQ